MSKCIYVLVLCRLSYAINFVNLRKFKLRKFLKIKLGMFAYKSIFGKTYSPWSEGNFDRFMKADKKTQNLLNWRGHAYQN